MQVVNVHLCRSRRRSIVERPLFENRLIWAGIVAEVALILLVHYAEPGQARLGTAPTGYVAWLLVLPCALSMLLLEEARKAIVRWRPFLDAWFRTRNGSRPRKTSRHTIIFVQASSPRAW
jgi:sodium/potassium-transporting ATPase subunit alpha